MTNPAITKSIIELKILDVNPKEIAERLRSLRARVTFNRLMTRTLMFDHPTLRLRSTGKVLRLRQVGKKVFMSIKSGGEGASQSPYHKVIESELEINDFNQAFQMFESMGFTAFRYQEKYRTGYCLDDGVNLELNEFPNIPSYLEVQAHSEEAMRNIIHKIGYTLADGVKMSATDILRHYGVKDVDIVRFPDSEPLEGMAH